MTVSRLNRTLLSCSRGPFLLPDGTGGGGGETGPTGPTGTTGATAAAPEFTPEQQRELDRRIAAARREGRSDGKTEAEQAADQQRQQEQRDREQRDLEAKGEFETVKANLTTERDTLKGERDRLKTENDQYRTAIEAGLKAGWEALPEGVRKLGEKQHGEDDPLGRWTFLHDPDTTALVEQLAPANQHDRGRGPGNPDPKPHHRNGQKPTVEETLAEMKGQRR